MENLEVQELSKQEIIEINGGAGNICAGIVISAATVIMTDWANFKAGLLGDPPVKKK